MIFICVFSVICKENKIKIKHEVYVYPVDVIIKHGGGDRGQDVPQTTRQWVLERQNGTR